MPWLTARADQCNCKDHSDFHIIEQKDNIITHQCRNCGYICKQSIENRKCQPEEHEFVTVTHGLESRKRICRICNSKKTDSNKLPKPLTLAELMTMEIANYADPPLTFKQRTELQRKYEEQLGETNAK